MPVVSRSLINGAKWWKFDFHTHTPASHDYGKGSGQRELQDRSPRDWLLDFMRAEIDCVAVTDHNSGQWVDQLKAELTRLSRENHPDFRPLHLFPGVEISVNGGVHLLAIFPETFATADITAALATCGFDGTHGNTDECTTKSLSEVISVVVRRGGLAIPAHVDKENGLFTLQGVPGQGPTLQQNLGQGGLLAIELCDSTFVRPQIYREMKTKLAEVIGSDSHRPEQVGRSFTWVKMDAPTFDALRLALHDGADGIIRGDQIDVDPNDTGNRFIIRSISILNGARAGRGSPLNVQFSPWLTTLIGGRGSGKSSVIEYLRLALDQQHDLPAKLKLDFQDFAQAPAHRGKKGMLNKNPDTLIRIEMIKEGRQIALVWENSSWREYHQAGDGSWIETGSAGNVRERFSIRVFSQKHLYEMTQDPHAVLHLIDSQFAKSEWLEERGALEKKWLNSRRIEREHRSGLSNIDSIKAELGDILAQMKVFEESGHKAILENFQRVQRIKGKIDQDLKIGGFSYTIADLCEDVPVIKIDDAEREQVGSESASIIDRYISEWDAIRSEIIAIAARVKDFDERLSTALTELPWMQTLTSASAAYADLVARLAGAGASDPNGYGQLIEKRKLLEEKLNAAEQMQKNLAKQEQESEKNFIEILNHEKRLRHLRNEVIQHWSQGTTNQGIKVTLQPMSDLEQAESSIRQLLRKSGSEFASSILKRGEGDEPVEGFLFELCNSPDVAVWDKREEIARKLASVTESNPVDLDRRFVRHIESLRQNTPEDIDRMLTWYPEDRVVLRMVRNGRDEDIETGSAGQRTAGMLGLLLSLDGGPLFLDQPEDDLDTRLISDLVVKGLRSLKRKQQVVVVTHNPNIPVNGAAEQIVEMRYLRGQVQPHVSGALQNRDIRKAICNVMEGGRVALNNRYFRISHAIDSDDDERP